MATEAQLLGGADIRELAARLDVVPTKKLGQNFVTDPNTIRRIVAAAKLDGTETVVEIGPGLGSLTLGLIEIANKVIAVEIDPKMAAALQETINKRAPGANFSLIHQDALKVTDLGDAPKALVANLPYNISVPVLLHFLEHFASLQSGLVLVQAEVAHRLAARPGNKIYGVPSVKLAWYAESNLAGNVGRNIFWPVPNVDSALVYFVKRDQPLGDETLRLATFDAVDAAFGQRRKTLRQALAEWAGGSPAAAETILVAAGIDPTKRGEQLDVFDFVKIAQAKQAHVAAAVATGEPVPSATAIGEGSN
jgi:16S rRNA (adenine1518-N6/adenine1519-N6)-dimethyltransferase